MKIKLLYVAGGVLALAVGGQLLNCQAAAPPVKPAVVQPAPIPGEPAITELQSAKLENLQLKFSILASSRMRLKSSMAT